MPKTFEQEVAIKVLTKDIEQQEIAVKVAEDKLDAAKIKFDKEVAQLQALKTLLKQRQAE